jgi:hypothetical protein
MNSANIQINTLTLNNMSTGERMVEISLDTGEVTLFGTPTEAAITFWKAVEYMYPNRISNKE